MVRIGLIGAGTVGAAYVESIQRMPNVTLQAIADPNVDRAKTLTESTGAKVLEEVYDLISMDDVDAIVVASPTPFHFYQARAAVQAGKHVCLEIPMVRQLKDAEELVDLSQKSSAVITVAHLLRYYPEYQLMKQQVEQNAVGKPATIRLGRRTPHPRRWYSKFDASGGVILDAMVHEFDFLQWCFGPVKRVFCQAMRGRQENESLDYALASIRMESGAIAHVESSWCHYGQFTLDVEIAGENGVIQYNNNDSVPLHFSEIEVDQGTRRYYFESPVSEPAFHKLFQSFINAVEGKEENPVPVEDGFRAVQLALAAIHSAETKKPIDLNTFKCNS